MTIKHSPDDIAKLCVDCGLNPDQYRTFSRTGSSQTLVLSSGPVSVATQQLPVAPVVNSPEPTLVSAIPASTPKRGRSLLQSLTSRNGSNQERRTSSLELASKPQQRLSFISAAGGVGTTTLVATLARIYTLRGEEVLLFDRHPNSILPFYFGSPRVLSGSCTLRAGGSDDQGLLHIVSPREASDEQGLEGMQSLLQSVDRVLIDNGDELPVGAVPGSKCLMVVTPDVRCLVQAVRLQERCEREGSTPHFLISQFDESQQLHWELRSSLANALGHGLLPFAMRRSDDVAGALADGRTVVDCAPHSALVHDFEQLTEWLVAADLQRPMQAAAAGGD